MKRKVLMITGTFPPQEDVGGLRPAMFSKYLPDFGWAPIILTRKYPICDRNYKQTLTGIDGLPPSSDIIEIEMATDDECIGHTGISAKIFRFLCPEYGQSWDLIERMINRFLTSGFISKIDAIYATSPSFGEIAVGMTLARKMGVPIIVDFRDITEQSKHIGFRDHLLHLRHIVRRYWLTRTAYHAIAVSKEQQRILARRLSIPVSTIINGYDEAMFMSIPNLKTKRFVINYVGRILEQSLQDPSVFFAALDLLLNDSEVDQRKIDVNFIGCEVDILGPLLTNYRCKKWVTIKPRIEYAEVPLLISQSCINLVLTNIGRTGVLTTKFFEYLAVCRPILCVPHDKGALAAMITQTNSGLASSNSSEVALWIKNLYLEWQLQECTVPVNDSIGIEAYSRKAGAKQLAAILDASVRKIDDGGPII